MAVIMEQFTSNVYKHGRLDPEYFLPEHTNIENILDQLPKDKLGKLGKFTCSAFYPAATHLYESGNMPFLRCVDIINYPVISNDQPFAKIPDNFVKKYKSIRTLKAGDVIISKVGSPCFSSIIDNEMPISAMTRTVLGMTDINEDKVDKYYLIAYLRSAIGFSQLMRERELTIQYQLTLDRTRNIEIFLPDIKYQREIGILVKSYFQKKQLSQSLYTQAQQLLERELGLDKLVFDKPLSYEARLSEVVGNNRADADYYQIPFRLLEEHLKNLNTIPLGKIATVIKGIEVGSDSYVESGIPFLRVSNIKEKGISLGNSDKYISSQLYSALKCYQPQVGELLLTKDGTPGVCYTVTDEIEGIVSGGVVRLQLHDNSFPKEYLSLVVNSRICKMQIDQECSGALIVHWKPISIRKLKIPVLSDSTMKELGRLVLESKKALAESQQLLEQAKRRVEELIEQAVQK